MSKNRPSNDTTPAAGPGMTADERGRAAGTGEAGVAGDVHVAGPPPAATGPVDLAGDTAPDLAPHTVPDAAPGTAPVTAPDAPPDAGRGGGRHAAQDASSGPVFGRDEVATGFPAPTPQDDRRDGREDREDRDRFMDPEEATRFQERWRDVQSAFVDDPAEAVRRAEDLATEAADALGRALAERRRALSEPMTAGGGEPDTERLRLALREYRVLVERICGT